MKVTKLDEKKRRELLRKRAVMGERKQKAADKALRQRMNQKIAKKYKQTEQGGFFADRQTNIWLAIIAIVAIFLIIYRF